MDAVVRHPSLRKIVGADALRTVPAADEQPPGLRSLRIPARALRREEARFQQRHGPRPVPVLRALVLALDDRVRRQMGDPDRGVGLVQVLSSRSRRPERIDPQIGGGDVHVIHLVHLRQHRHRARGGVDASLRFGLRHPLYAVAAGFELEPRVRSAPHDPDDDFLVPSVLAGAAAHDLGLPARELAVAQVHPEQIAREQCGLVPPGAGPYLQVHVARVGRIGGEQQDLQLVLQARPPALRRFDLFLREGAQIRVRPREECARVLDRADRPVVLHEAFDDRAQFGMLSGERPEPGRVGGDLGLGEQCADLDEPLAQPFEPVRQ